MKNRYKCEKNTIKLMVLSSFNEKKITVILVLVVIGVAVILVSGRMITTPRAEKVNESCLHKSFEIREVYSQYDPKSHVFAVYIQNTGLREIEPSLIIVSVGDSKIEKRLNETKITIPRGSSAYIYINVSEFFGENGEHAGADGGPEIVKIFDKCVEVTAIAKRPPLGWSFFTYKGEQPLI